LSNQREIISALNQLQKNLSTFKNALKSKRKLESLILRANQNSKWQGNERH